MGDIAVKEAALGLQNFYHHASFFKLIDNGQST